ncbi:hypothetical protein Fmac_011676 [Flemingia macrophylla]|uniref:Uncharacterized protein n=1 Tax=Flemingia macrophylla TaxID=520843 RepID=A0ABD1MN47_9FABA
MSINILSFDWQQKDSTGTCKLSLCSRKSLKPPVKILLNHCVSNHRNIESKISKEFVLGSEIYKEFDSRVKDRKSLPQRSKGYEKKGIKTEVKNINYGLVSSQTITPISVAQVQGVNNLDFTSVNIRSFTAPGSDASVSFGSRYGGFIYDQEYTSILTGSLEDSPFASGFCNPNFSGYIVDSNNK